MARTPGDIFSELATSEPLCSKPYKKNGCWLAEGHDGACEGPDDDEQMAAMMEVQ